MIQKQDIFPEGSLAPCCHAATVTEVRPGLLLCAWYAGSYETATDQRIYLSRGDKTGGRWSWSQPRTLFDSEGKADGNPVLFTDSTGRVWLFFVTLQDGGWRSAILKVTGSADGGETWEEPQILSAIAGVMSRTKPVILPSGQWLLPLYDERSYSPIFWVSEDGGRTWRERAQMRTRIRLIQPAVIVLSDGRLLSYFRSSSGWVYRSTSDDEGKRWSPPERTDLSNPDSALDLIRLPRGGLVLAFNPYQDSRTPLTVAYSPAEDEKWVVLRDLEVGDGEFSYPCLIADSAGNVHCVYTYRRRTIRHATFDATWLLGGP